MEKKEIGPHNTYSSKLRANSVSGILLSAGLLSKTQWVCGLMNFHSKYKILHSKYKTYLGLWSRSVSKGAFTAKGNDDLSTIPRTHMVEIKNWFP